MAYNLCMAERLLVFSLPAISGSISSTVYPGAASQIVGLKTIKTSLVNQGRINDILDKCSMST